MKGILFDNDGTLVDTHDIILASMRFSTQKVLGRVIPDEILMAKVGQPLVVQMVDFTPDEEEQAEILRVYRAHNAQIHDAGVRAFSGARQALVSLSRQGYALGVVTSKLRVTAWRGLEITGLSEHLSCCIGAEDCNRYKPEAEPVLRGAEALDLSAGECYYIGDAPYDIQAGNAAGCKTIAVTWGMFPEQRLVAEGPDFVCHSFPELLETIDLQ